MESLRDNSPHRGSDLSTIAASTPHSPVDYGPATPQGEVVRSLYRWKNGLRAQVGDDVGEILITKRPGSVRDHSN